MSIFLEEIFSLREKNEDLFYNSSGSKQAYQLNIKHLSAAEFLGFVDTLPNKDLRAKKSFYLVDLENEEILHVEIKDILKLVSLVLV